MRRGGIAVAAAAVVVSCCAMPGPEQRAEIGAGVRAFASPQTREMVEARAAQVGRVSYGLRLDLDPERDAYEGRVAIDFELREGASGDLGVDFHDGAIRELAINDAILPPGEVSARYDGQRLRLAIDELRAAAPNRVEIAFAHAYSTTGNGFHRFVDPADGRVYVYTNFEPWYANRMFPCFDQPDLKATYELTVEAPDDWELVANTRESERTTRGSRTLWRFPRSLPFSTYLFALHAGPWASWAGEAGDVPLRLFARRSLAPFVEHGEWLEVTRQGLAFFGERFGAAYPFGKYDQVIVPDFNAGAMENVAAITFSERYVHRGRITRDERRDRADTILHEMAHMWFGDLVTMRWWNGLWLNESFASWASAWAVEEATDFGEGWQAFFAGMKRWAYREDQLVTSHPIDTPVPDTDHAFASFDGITYGKGASALQQLAFVVGEDAFVEGLRRYFRRFAFGNTELADFIGALEEASGRDLGDWTGPWLETAGLNAVEASWACAPDPGSGNRVLTRLDLRQSPSEWSGVLRPHRTRVGLHSIRSHARRIADAIDVSYAGPQTAVQQAIGWPCPDLVFPNEGDQDYVKVILDPESLAVARRGVGEVDDALLRQQIWHSLWEGVVDGRLSARDYADAALAQIEREEDTLVLGGVLASLVQSSLGAPSALKYLRDSEREAYRDRMERVFRRALERAPAGSDLQLTWYFALLEVASAPATLGLLEDLLVGEREIAGLSIEQDRRWELIQALARAGAPRARRLLADELASDPTAAGRKAAIAAEASLPDAETKAAWRARMEADPGPGQPSDSDLREAMAAHHRLGQEELSRQAVDWYFTILPTFAATRDDDLVEAFSASMFPALCDVQLIDRVNEFLDAHPALPAAAQRNLQIARQEEERCLRARRLAAAAG